MGSFALLMIMFVTSANAQLRGSTPVVDAVSKKTPDGFAKETLYGDSLYVSRDGHIFKKGEDIQLGNSTWTHAFANITTLATTLSRPGYKKVLSSDYAGRRVTIQSIERLKDGKVYLRLDLKDPGKLNVDIERALFTKEVIVE